MKRLSTDKMYHWDTDSEIQYVFSKIYFSVVLFVFFRIDGDLEVIPISSNFCDINIRDPNNPSNVNIHHIMNNWQQFVDIMVCN